MGVKKGSRLSSGVQRETGEGMHKPLLPHVHTCSLHARVKSLEKKAQAAVWHKKTKPWSKGQV